jgi:ATP-binding cassette subfamily C (CFTR/MRP) protein 2
MLIPIVAFFTFSWLMQRFYMHANRELYRLESISKSPILSFFGESLLGLPTIRAFGKCPQFLKRHGDNMDLNRKIFIEQILVSTWFNLTLSLCSFVVNISAITFCVFYSTKNPAYAGLLLTYAASLD